MKERTTSESLCTFGKSLIPIFGYYSGRDEGFKDGIAAVSDEYARKLGEANACNRQLRKELLGECAAFICPKGWDPQYWQRLVKSFADKNPTPEADAKTILERFICDCLESFPSDRHLGETKRELSMILDVLQAEAKDRLSKSQESIEITIDFLDFFRNFPGSSGEAYFEQLPRLRDELIAALDTSLGCNFLILGKTGSGKSALLNYILGADLAASGAGHPVTEPGLHLKQGVINGVKVNVYDSWGLEAGHYDDWLEMLDREKEKHDLYHKVTDWFHVVVHCISGDRVEDVDAKIVNGFLKDGFKVIVALTKADNCSEDDERTMKKTIIEECPGLTMDSIISVCSVEKVIRGVTHSRFGADKMKNAIIGSYVGTIVRRLPLRVNLLANKEVDTFRQEMLDWIGTRTVWKSANMDELKARCEKFMTKLNEVRLPAIIKDELLACTAISQSLSATINVENDYFKNLSSGSFFDPDQPWYLDIAQAVFTAIALPVLAVMFVFGGGTSQERKDLTERLDKFVAAVRDKLANGENDLAKRIRAAFEYVD